MTCVKMIGKFKKRENVLYMCQILNGLEMLLGWWVMHANNF